MRIRPEEPRDFEAIGRVVEAAFDSPPHAALVQAIRASDQHLPALALVAETDGEVVGYVMVSRATLVTEGGVLAVHNLSPLAVHPAWQARGIGSALVRDVCARADVSGVPMVILEGDPKYYSRFGFEPAYRYGIEMALPSWAPREAGQVLRLTAYDPTRAGRVQYPPAFDAVAEH